MGLELLHGHWVVGQNIPIPRLVQRPDDLRAGGVPHIVAAGVKGQPQNADAGSLVLTRRADDPPRRYLRHLVIETDGILQNLAVEAAVLCPGVEGVGVLWQAIAAIPAAGVEVGPDGARLPPLVHVQNAKRRRRVNAANGVRSHAHLISITNETS